MPYKRDVLAILSGFVLAGLIALVLVHSQPSQAAPVVHLNPVSEDSTSSMLVTTTTVATKPPVVPAKPAKHVVQSTTSTTAPPPALTADQEACIPVEGETEPAGCEHMPSYPYEDRDYAQPQQ